MNHLLRSGVQRVLSLFSILAIQCLPFSAHAQELPKTSDPSILAGFNARGLEDRYVIANWTIEPGHTDTRYALERSSDGITFETLEQVDNGIATNGNFQYAYFDEQPHAGASYYRLRVTSGDKQVNYSKTLQVQVKTSQASLNLIPDTQPLLTASNRTPKGNQVLQQVP